VSAAPSPSVVAVSAIPDRVALAALEHALEFARAADDRRPAFALLEEALHGLSGGGDEKAPSAMVLVERGREDWLQRLRSAGRSRSALVAYRQAVDDLIDWARREGRGEELFEARAIVAYLDDYRARRAPAAATYHRRFSCCGASCAGSRSARACAIRSPISTRRRSPARRPRG
jgi:hypothetical protein